MKSIQRSIAFQFSVIADLSPYCSHTVQGRITPASPQPGAPSLLSGRSRSGETLVNAPSLVCASVTSFKNLCENNWISKLKVPVRQKTPASPIQPSRSSLCGQSVGMLRKFPRCPHSPTFHMRFTRSLDVTSLPVGSPTRLLITSPLKSAVVGVPG